MSVKCGIYKITNIVNGKAIIGLSDNISKRWNDYKRFLRKGAWENSYLQNAWNKYGEQNFKFEILLECTKERLNEEEIRLIKEYRTNERQYGYNILDGGDRPSHTDETKKKISEANKKFYSSNKYLNGPKIDHKGSKNPFYGKSLTDEHKKKMSIALTGRHHSEETKRKIGDKHRGKIVSDETKIKISKAQTGKKLSEEHKRKLSEAGKKRGLRVLKTSEGGINKIPPSPSANFTQP